MKIYIEYEEECIFDESDFNNEDFSGSWYSEYDYNVVGATVSQPKSVYHEEFNIDTELTPSNVHVVVVKYSTGDTFGHSTGRGHIEKVCKTLKEAETIAQQIKDETYSNGDKYLVWTGFFESLEGVEVITLNVK